MLSCQLPIVRLINRHRYALSHKNFESLFVSTTERTTRKQILQEEKAKYTFSMQGAAFGEPLSFSCYSRLEVTVVEVRRNALSRGCCLNCHDNAITLLRSTGA